MQACKSELAYGYLDSPIGPLLVAGDADQLCLISFPSEGQAYSPQTNWLRDDTVFKTAFEQLSAYFAGELTQFDLPLRFGRHSLPEPSLRRFVRHSLRRDNFLWRAGITHWQTHGEPCGGWRQRCKPASDCRFRVIGSSVRTNQ